MVFQGIAFEWSSLISRASGGPCLTYSMMSDACEESEYEIDASGWLQAPRGVKIWWLYATTLKCNICQTKGYPGAYPAQSTSLPVSESGSSIATFQPISP